MMNKLLDALQPALIALALAVISGCSLAATAFFQQLAAKLKEGKDRDAMHRALETGAKLAATKHPNDTREAAAYVVDYAMKSTPEAIANLLPDGPKGEEILGKLALSKLTSLPGVQP
jgi:hypothetical protein